MKYKIAVCDDMDEDIQYIVSAVNSWAEKERVTADIEKFSSAESFLFTYAERKDFDILLLDIEMQSMSGMELAKKIREENDTVQIIFITGFPDFMSEGYEVSALHYLMKPVSAQKLSEVLNRAVSKLNKKEKSVMFTVNSELMRIAVSDIISVEAFAHSCMVTTVKSSFEVKLSITNIEKMLSEAANEAFVRCHRSYIAGVKYIKGISKTEVLLDNGFKIPLSRSNYQSVNQAFIRYFRGEAQWDL